MTAAVPQVATASKWGLLRRRRWPQGTFAAPLFFAVGQPPSALAAADLNKDGKMDLSSTNENDGILSILPDQPL